MVHALLQFQYKQNIEYQKEKDRLGPVVINTKPVVINTNRKKCVVDLSQYEVKKAGFSKIGIPISDLIL